MHGALAEATDPESASERITWHRAQAATQPDEELAAELERSADREQALGGFAQAQVFLQQATLMTPDPVIRRDGRFTRRGSPCSLERLRWH